MLFINAAVLYRHLPACKRDHSAATGFVDFIQCGALEFSFSVLPLEGRQGFLLPIGTNADKPGLLRAEASLAHRQGTRLDVFLLYIFHNEWARHAPGTEIF